jgi:hypothetical protein
MLKSCRKVIVRYPVGYRFVTVLGVALSTVLIVFLISRGFSITDFIGSLLVCYLISGIVGMSIYKGIVSGIVGCVLSVSSIICFIMMYYVVGMYSITF